MFNLSALLCLWIPITFVLFSENIGLQDEPCSVLAEWTNSYLFIFIILPLELVNSFSFNICGKYIWLLIKSLFTASCSGNKKQPSDTLSLFNISTTFISKPITLKLLTYLSFSPNFKLAILCSQSLYISIILFCIVSLSIEFH